MEISDLISIQEYGLIEETVDLPTFQDDFSYPRALSILIQSTARPKRTLSLGRVIIPNYKLFENWNNGNIIRWKVKISNKVQIKEVTYRIDTSNNAVSMQYCEIESITRVDPLQHKDVRC